MLKLSAVLINTFTMDSYTNRETGAITPPKNKFQLLVDKPMKNGTSKKEMIDLSVNDEVFNRHKESIGKIITIDVGYFGNITFFGI